MPEIIQAEDNHRDEPDSIRSALDAAFAESEKPADPASAEAAPKPAATEAAVDPAETAEEKTAREGRDALGRFTAKEKTEGEPAPDPAAAAVVDPAADSAAKPATREAPAPWGAADKEMFAKLPPEAQEFVLRRYGEMDADYVRKTQLVAHLRKEYEPVDKLFEPYRDAMRTKGFSPRSLIEAWANVETRLAQGDGVNIIKGLVSGYNIDPWKVAEALGLSQKPGGAAAPGNGNGADPAKPPPAAAVDPSQSPPLHPAVVEQLSKIQQRLDAEDRMRADNARRGQVEAVQRVENEIETFKSAQDGKGNLLHPHFAEVEAQMALLANAAVASRQKVPPLQELYDTAVWAHPSTREKLRTAETQAAEQKRLQVARDKAAQAKRAGSSVTGAPSGGGQAQAKSAERSLREEIEAAADDAA